MSIFVQKIKEDVLQVTHKFVNYMEARKRGPLDVSERTVLEQKDCELAASRLILYATNWVNHLARENITADKRSFYIDSDKVNRCCQVIKNSPLYESNSVFPDIVKLIRRLQRVNHAPPRTMGSGVVFSLGQ